MSTDYQPTPTRRVLVTGADGRVGRRTVTALSDAGWAVRPFDLTTADDIRNEVAVCAATQGCEAVVHTAAIAHDTAGTPSEIVATNVLGTWHVLCAAELARVARVVVFSSAQVFGCAEGEGQPAYLPIDDQHPVRATRPYGMSKRLIEDMCEAWTARVGIPTIVFRPVMILNDQDLQTFDQDNAEFGAMIHVDDVAEAVVAALTRGVDGHVRAILCGPGDFDTTVAHQRLGWQPTVSWPTHTR